MSVVLRLRDLTTQSVVFGLAAWAQWRKLLAISYRTGNLENQDILTSDI